MTLPIHDPRDLASLAVAVAESFESNIIFTRRIWRGSCDHLGGRVGLYRFCADVSAQLLEALAGRPEADYPGCRDYELPEVFRDHWIEQFNAAHDSLQDPKMWSETTVRRAFGDANHLKTLALAAVNKWFGNADVPWDVRLSDGNGFQVWEPDFEAAYSAAKELTNKPIVEISSALG